MVQSQTNSTTKCCATCSKWLGCRMPHNSGYYVILEDAPQNVYGKCSNQMNSCNEKQAVAPACSNYDKWSALK